MANQRAGILGTGHAYPEGILTNADLATMVETSDDWITTRTGIKQRRKAGPDEYTSLFAVRAARKAIERARLTRSRPCEARAACRCLQQPTFARSGCPAAGSGVY